MNGRGRLAIVGLGPGDPSLRTIGAQRLLDEADAIVLRTRIHPGLEDLTGDPRVSDCDDLYQGATEFPALYEAIAERVFAVAAKHGLTVFAVPGHPRFGERSVALIVNLAAERNVAVEVHNAVSFVDAAVLAASADPIADGLQIIDAEELSAILDREPFAAGLLGLDPTRSLLVSQIYNGELAAATKLALARLYPDDHEVVIIRGAGVVPPTSLVRTPLHLLDRAAVDHLTSVWLPPLDPLHCTRSPFALTRLIARLRAPGGCPWDREQTHHSLRAKLIEEAYETVDALDSGDAANLAEELGDLLLLITMLAQIAEEQGEFCIEDVYDHVNAKIVRRHPHVFGDVLADTPEAVIATWDGVKAAERSDRGADGAEPSPFERLPRAMPALEKAAALLAPRQQLDPPAEPRIAYGLFRETRRLIESGIDPERALSLLLQSTSSTDADDLLVKTAADGRMEESET